MEKYTLITEDFLLDSEPARRLFHEYAKPMPIIDYHCHIPPAEIAGDHRYENMTQIWLYGDHYKWRAMRASGVDERFCTGDASDWEKFQRWAETVPKTLRNPLYHWTHLELKHPFGISDRLLNGSTARGIWDECNEKLRDPAYSCRGIIKYFNVALICTTDDPVDSLEHHKAIASDPSFNVTVLPAWRPDKAMAVEDPSAFNAYVDKLGQVADIDIRDFSTYVQALRKRHDFFASMGCRVSDHGIETIYAEPYTDREIDFAFADVRSGKTLPAESCLKFKSAMLHLFGVMDHEKGWVQQYHLSAFRSVNSRMVEKIGPDSGYDSIGDFEIARPLGRFLDTLERNGQLTKTILYSLNPAHNALLATMIGNFQDGATPGKMQFGSGWWFLDQIDGMRRQMEDLSNMGLLSQFVGMLTDSRSFLSYTRHEYFRRLLCNILGEDMSKGLIPTDYELVGGMVRDICYFNAARYFEFNVPMDV